VDQAAVVGLLVHCGVRPTLAGRAHGLSSLLAACAGPAGSFRTAVGDQCVELVAPWPVAAACSRLQGFVAAASASISSMPAGGAATGRAARPSSSRPLSAAQAQGRRVAAWPWPFSACSLGRQQRRLAGRCTVAAGTGPGGLRTIVARCARRRRPAPTRSSSSIHALRPCRPGRAGTSSSRSRPRTLQHQDQRPGDEVAVLFPERLERVKLLLLLQVERCGHGKKQK
jgi:hypothetical protein